MLTLEFSLPLSLVLILCLSYLRQVVYVSDPANVKLTLMLNILMVNK